MNDDLEDALKNYLLLLEKEAYFEAHEVLEEAWHPLRLKKHPLANVVKGFINAAISLEHVKRNRIKMKSRAIRVIASYERYQHLVTKDMEHATLFLAAKEKVELLKSQHEEVFGA